jgi:transcriptional regulator with XRE-family HTH domain
MSKDAVSELSRIAAEEIRVWMTRRRISGERLARELGVSAAWVSYRLNGQVDLKLGELAKIAEILRVHVADLLPEPALRRPGDALTRRSGNPNNRPRFTRVKPLICTGHRLNITSPGRVAGVDRPATDPATRKANLGRSRRPVRLCGGVAR